jgi:multiple sugar transport system permease protein
VALQSIPKEYYKAAELDGAGEARVFALIVLPMSRPILALRAVPTFRPVQLSGALR